MDEKVARTQHRISRERVDSSQGHGQGPEAFNLLILAGLAMLLMASPLALGAVAPWARCMVFCGLLLLGGLWFLREAWSGRLDLAKSWVWVPMGLFFLLGALQLVPLPWNVLSFLSPNTAETYTHMLAHPESTSHTLSLFPYGTRMALLHVASLGLIFFLVVHSVKRRRDAIIIILALLVIGVFEALYGFGEQFSGNRHVLWQERQAHLAAVTGTFFNKNHLAGMLAMILPLALGFLMALLPRERRAGTLRARLLRDASSSRMLQLVILPCAIIVLAIAICFSLSRAGIISSLIAIVAFAICMGLTIGFRKYTLLLVFLMTAILLVAVGIGSELVVERMEDIASGRSASWADRINLSLSGWHMFKEFPTFGTGLGSFRYAFERFQSVRFGDRVADYLHNDWLQLLCEMGWIGGIIVIAGLIALVSGTARRAFSRHDAFCKWVALGALVGVAAMVMHSFFDYNLYKITSNGLIFATLLGLAFSVARMPSNHAKSHDRRDIFTLSLGPVPARICLTALVTVGLIFAAARPMHIATANIALNRYLAQSGIGTVDPYFFLPPKEPDPTLEGSDIIEKGKQRDPGNPQYDYYASRLAENAAESLLLAKARAAATQLLGPQQADLNADSFERMAEALAVELASQPSPERAILLRQQEAALRMAVSKLPICARYHLALAQTLTRLKQLSANPSAVSSSESPIIHIQRAVWCAPRKPAILYASAMTLLMNGATEDTAASGASGLDAAIPHFRTAILADPTYAEQVYPVVRCASSDSHILAKVTPKTLRTYAFLCQTLWQDAKYEDLLACLDVLDDLVAKTEENSRALPWTFITRPEDAGERTEQTLPSELSKENLQQIHVLRTKLQALRLRCEVLAILGRTTERDLAVATYRQDLQHQLAETMDDAQVWIRRHRYNEAMAALLKVLEKDWSNPEALLLAADTSGHIGALDGLAGWNRPLDFLYRLVINNDHLHPDTLARLEQHLAQLDLADAEDTLVAEFIAGAAPILGGQAETGIQQLESLAQGKRPGFSTWRQRHLVWQFMGDGYLALGKPDQAARAYETALEIVPHHGPTLERLANLNSQYQSRLQELSPSVSCNVVFGGKLVFLGYDLTRETVPVTLKGSGINLPDGITVDEQKWFMTYYWQATDRMLPGYRPSVQFCDEDWGVIFRDNHELSDADGPYPTDFPKSGEIIIEKRALRGDPTTARYLRLGISTPSPRKPFSASIPFDAGRDMYATSVNLEKSANRVSQRHHEVTQEKDAR